MHIKVWGCRGSLTTAGPGIIRYGGYTTCVEVLLGDGTLAIIDSGSGIHKLGRSILGRPEVKEIYLLLTHSHWDHLTGFPFFTPAYLEKYRIHVRGGPDAKTSLHKYLAHQMDPPFFPVDFSHLKAGFDFDSDGTGIMSIGSAEVVSVPLSHPNGGYGFVFRDGGKRFVFLTDNEPGFDHAGGLREEDYVEVSRGADLLFHDAQYSDAEYAETTRGWGHSSYSHAAELAVKAGVGRFGTFHHDPDHDDNEIDSSMRLCRSIIKAHKAKIECFAVAEGMELTV